MFINRCNSSIFSKSFFSSYVTAILGPRRVGKSTLIQEFSSKNNGLKWVFLNMDLMLERQRVEKGELEKLIQEKSLQPLSSENSLWVAIDEAQKCPALFEQIKVLYDRFINKPKTIKFILTGSGSLSLHQLSAETLAGRIEIFHLRDFNLRETADLKLFSHHKTLPTTSFWESLETETLQAHINKLEPFREILEDALEEQLVWGGLPEILLMPEHQGLETQVSDRLRYLGNYFQTYLEKDIRDIGVITDLPLYQKMVEVIAGQTGSVREDRNILQALGCSRDTLKKYRGFLEATLLYTELYPYMGSSLKRLVKSPKGYLMDNGLISYLTGIQNLQVLIQTGLVGHRFENWVLKEVQIALDRDPRKSQVYFWRTSGQVEVDLVIEKAPQVIPIEVTFGEKIQGKKVSHLKSFLREEAKARFGLYIYNGPFQYSSEDRIFFIPAWVLV